MIQMPTVCQMFTDCANVGIQLAVTEKCGFLIDHALPFGIISQIEFIKELVESHAEITSGAMPFNGVSQTMRAGMH
jgi:hypothetical protein